ncbi:MULTISPECIES: thioesterase family protein [Halobacterium]|uniref:Thioesterase domain protein n=4 Tax=Halobacterium salinarum TaxID=2242 RepID=Q9HPZ1_HALSA|nr:MULTISPECIES: thioesterase family protein [Halobacterium]AAG19726.1 conserved hypothetical protein [Halobacterium salinarum NRC-1]MBB6088729.1 acyl-CoA thioester hydrolase [Halobacterium salinarum]MCF2165236.1 acyl-CoA thioesterase [Halobacterium salinarum]MCF2167955.1 acyl-CoA thioesterase [Halobacterium salinarum]MCF2208095.1 acyl-CoA thioesterase [Halobacterium salinarum]
MTEFAFTETVDVRYQDHDTMGHVNNAVYVTYMEQARFAYLTDGIGRAPTDLDMVVVNLSVDFNRPVEFADTVTVGASITHVGDTSFTMAYEVRDDDGVVATGETVQVALDPDTGQPRSVPDDWRRAIDAIEA